VPEYPAGDTPLIITLPPAASPVTAPEHLKVTYPAPGLPTKTELIPRMARAGDITPAVVKVAPVYP
tara:strand:+ start:1113 stop:1310 length:198 start_codon:yes stop_codon:yes gene_type:complete